MSRYRVVLRIGLGLLLAVSTLGPRAASEAKDKVPAFPEHVILVILGGGVRSVDLTDEKLMPTLAAMAEEGTVIRKIDSGAPDAYSGAARILCGGDESIDAATRPHPTRPTLCEYVRRGRELPATKVWFVSFAGEEDLHLAHSTDPGFGSVFAPSVASGFGAFAEPLRSFLDALGRPVPMEPEAWSQIRRLRTLSRNAMSVWLPREVDAGLPRSERVERALLRELDRKALLLRGPNPRDEQAFRAALTLLEIHRPALLVLRLGEAEQAQASFAAYRKVLAAADGGLKRLRAAVAKDKKMGGKTTFLVVADRGRNEKPDASGRLDADDASKQRGQVSLVYAGPGRRRRGRLKGPRSIDDICPTIGHLLGVKTEAATGTAWLGLLNER